MQHPQGDADHLQILGPCGSRDHAGLRPHVEDDGFLQPWDQEMCALVDDSLLHSGQTVEDDGARAAPDVVYGLTGQAHADGCWDGEPVDVPKGIWVELRHVGSPRGG